MQKLLDFNDGRRREVSPFKTQLLKWIGNKQRFAGEIVSYFPQRCRCYFEPFLGSGAVLGTFSPTRAVASDVFGPLIEIWSALRRNPALLKSWYSERWEKCAGGDRQLEYERIKGSYNQKPNGADLLFLCRSCYGGVVRFRKADGYMSTPCGIHMPISPQSFSERVDEWHHRTANVEFRQLDYREAMQLSRKGDLIYCDPPYSETQSILYGAQSFRLDELFQEIARCKSRGVSVVLSIDGTKRSGDQLCEINVPDGLFQREVFVNCGRSMLRRFQMAGKTLEKEAVTDRLLMTY